MFPEPTDTIDALREVPDTELLFSDPTEDADPTEYELGRVIESPVYVLYRGGL